MSKTVLVTGGAGFIGSNYCRYLCWSNILIIASPRSTR